ncbi:DUF3626 domain-containing protein [Phycicoccus sp.]|uniref:DUF3626 domain-containing protein n=1 Tax=Phycicoccus sp. TaxID=1902410 RepID=UPI002C62F7F5|nr:DUF3626 domain-containing protein [Phycicoccus sp.]HMM97027.1 DUF3626 domain-containing protein [Phycicoccus sp.]
MTVGIVVHFHPGRPHGDTTVIEAIAASGVYRSQWETGTSNGGLTAVPGGARWRWESRLFEGRYDRSDPAARPVYGAWNRRGDTFGASPRFGSAYLRLRPEVTARATFCWPDSVYHPTAVGGPEKVDELCRLADAGVHDHTLLPEEAAGLPLDDPLNDYVEAHVHGGLELARDVEAVVVDPSDHEMHQEALARLGCPVEAHPGYRVTAESIDPAYRGSVPVELARRLGGDITPARLLDAWRTADPQAVKWLWHCLARFGRQEARSGS